MNGVHIQRKKDQWIPSLHLYGIQRWWLTINSGNKKVNLWIDLDILYTMFFFKKCEQNASMACTENDEGLAIVRSN